MGRTVPPQRKIVVDNGNAARAPAIPPYPWPLVIFLVVAVVGLFYVKWNPYYHKAMVAAAKHTLGASILSGNTPVAPVPSWEAAWGYAAAYFRAVWQAVVLGLVLGSLTEVLLPGQLLQRFFGSARLRGIALGGAAAVPSMMCTCCVAPVAVGMRKQSVPVGAALAYFLGNPVLNPATLVFMALTLSWQLVVLRLVVGMVAVFGISFVASKLMGDEAAESFTHEPTPAGTQGNWPLRWLRSLGRLALDSLPIYVVMVLLLGAARALLFPAINPHWGDSIWVIAGFAVAGTLFMIPTAAEIPIVQTMLSFGLSTGPAAALLVTLPAVSLPSLLMIRNSFSTRVLVFVAVAVAVLGVASGLLAGQLFRL